MSLVDDLTTLEQLLANLIMKYEQYFIGLEKREPLPLLAEVEKLIRRYSHAPITNTMYKHKYTLLVARFNTYREHWNKVVRQIEEGKYSRDRFISDLHQRQKGTGAVARPKLRETADAELDRVFAEFLEARRACNLPTDKVTRDLVQASIDKSRPALVARLGSNDLTFRVVVEEGRPRIKARQRK